MALSGPSLILNLVLGAGLDSLFVLTESMIIELEFTGALYYTTSRDDCREDINEDAPDRKAFD
jgi:hypothetical protein